jgi:O-antigen/teichoic acid export membrane protein
LFVFSDKLAILLFQDERVGDVLKVMTLQIFMGALASVHTALLQKELKFNRLFWVRLATVAVPGLFSIPLAMYGLSYWSLVIGTLAGQAIQVVLLWKLSVWRPRFEFNVPVAKNLGTFGLWVGVTGLLSWFFIWVDSLFVGSYLGTHQLGLYRTGNQFVTMIYGLLFAPLLPVLYSHFSGLQNEPERLRNILFRIIRVMTLISIPVAFLMFTLSNGISSIIFGQQWNGIEFVLAVMALMHGFSWVVGANGEVYRAIGKPSYETAVTSIMLVVYLAGYFISIQKSFEIFVWTRLGLGIVAMCVHIVFAWLAVRLNPLSIIGIVLMATVIGAIAPLVHILSVKLTEDLILQSLITGAVSVLLIGTILFIVERNRSVKEILTLLKRKEAV